LASPPVVTPHQEATALSNSNPATPDPAASETDSGGSGETSNAQVSPDKEGAVSVPADAKPAATPIAVAMPPSKGLIVVQLGSFHTATHAKMLTQTLGAKGHDLVVVHDHDRQGAEWFAVRTGEFPTQDAAESAAKELRDQGAWGAMVVHVARLKPMTADAKID
jgi:cell division septation protein DedD